MNKPTANTRLVAGLIAAGASTLALAQPQLEEIVVTAQKRAESLVEAPLTVNVVSGDQIRGLSMFSADELSKLTAGVELRTEGDSNSGVAIQILDVKNGSAGDVITFEIGEAVKGYLFPPLVEEMDTSEGPFHIAPGSRVLAS